MFGNLFTHRLVGVSLTDVMAPSVPGILTGVATAAITGVSMFVIPTLRKKMEEAAVASDDDREATILASACGLIDAGKAMKVGDLLKKSV